MTAGPVHRPVLSEAVLDCLGGCRTLLDCTVGLGGHAEMLLTGCGEDARLIALDVDPANLTIARERLSPFAERARFYQVNFSQARDVLDDCGLAGVDGLLADLGMASSQLDDPVRGLSFQADGPLDMRLDPTIETTAADLIARLSETDLADLIYDYGEERFSRRIASAIVSARRRERIERTGRLAAIIESAYPAAARRNRRGVHPATRTFQALRIAVGDELGNLDRLLEQLPRLLNAGGRACIISFHSLEDRRVKQAFAEMQRQGRARRITKKPRVADASDVAANPRSRSAKLRCLECL